jgi:hypothetical protein
MKKSNLASLMAILALPGAASAAIVIEDFSGSPIFGAVNGTTGSVVSGRLELSRPANDGFTLYAEAFVGRDSTTIAALTDAGAISFNYDIFGPTVGNADALAVRIVFSTDAWTEGTGNYRTFSTVVVPAATADGTYELSVSLLENPSIVAAAANYASGGGGFFGIVIDNNGFPTGANPISFALDNIRVETAPIPEPSSFAAVAALGALGLTMTRRRRDQQALLTR